MKIIKKLNRELRIEDVALNDYLELGYDEIDHETGEIITEGKTNAGIDKLKADVETLNNVNAKLALERDKLKAENAKLKEQLKKE